MAVESTREQPPSELLPQDAPESVREIADRGVRAAERGEKPADEVSAAAEHDAVFWLLQPPRAAEWESDVKYETPEGTRDLLWRLRSVKGSELDEMERRYVRAAGGNAEDLDDVGLAAEIVARATLRVVDKASGTVLDLQSEAFRRGIPSAAEALRLTMDFQSGILTSLASEVRRISGWGPDRVGKSRRVLVDVAGKS